MTTSTAVVMAQTGSESKTQPLESSMVHIEVKYFSCIAVRAAVKLLKKNENTSEVVKKFPDELHQHRVYRRPDIPLFFEINRISVRQNFVTLSLKDIIDLINELDEHTKKNKKYVAACAEKLSFIPAYFYLRKANKAVYEDELIAAQATAYLMQKVLELLKKEIAIPKVGIPTEDEEIPVNFLRRWVARAKTYFMEKAVVLLEKLGYSTNKIQTGNAEVLDSNSYLRWGAFILVICFHFVPIFYMSMYFAAESMESLTPYLLFVSPHVMAALGIICTLNILWGMVCFLGPLVMKWFRVNYSDDTPSLTSVYKEQLEAANSLDNHLIQHNNLSSITYEEYFTFSKNVRMIPSQNKEESVFATISTWIMTALTGIEAFSNSIMIGATLLGLVVGAFTFASVTPPILVAFVASHLWGVFLLSAPIAFSQGLVSYISRVTSASRLFDIEKEERDAVGKMRLVYKGEKPGILERLEDCLLKKKKFEKLEENEKEKTEPALQAEPVKTNHHLRKYFKYEPVQSKGFELRSASLVENESGTRRRSNSIC